MLFTPEWIAFYAYFGGFSLPVVFGGACLLVGEHRDRKARRAKA